MDLNYEMMYIVKPAEQEISKQVNAKLEKVITDNGGRIKDVNYWGERKLAYEINGFGRGVYVLLVFKGSQTVIKELDRVARTEPRILRLIDLAHPALAEQTDDFIGANRHPMASLGQIGDLHRNQVDIPEERLDRTVHLIVELTVGMTGQPFLGGLDRFNGGIAGEETNRLREFLKGNLRSRGRDSDDRRDAN